MYRAKTVAGGKKKSSVKIESGSEKESYWSSRPLTPASHIHKGDNC